MANGLDRLERFFAKRKPSLASTDSTGPDAGVGSVSEPKFPSPSFIRPKASRMAAREEVSVKQQSSQASQRVVSISPQSSTRSSNPYRLTLTPTRTSSLRQSKPQPLIVGFQDYQFPRPPTGNGDISPARSFSSANSSFENSQQNRSSPRKPLPCPKRLNTPPSSSDGAQYNPFINKKLPELPRGALPTPESSPELRPTTAPRLKESQSIEILNKDVYRDLQKQLGEPFDYNSLERALSSASLAPSSSDLSLSSSSLCEPDFNEFLNLSDDDVAEENNDCPSLSSSTDTSPAPSTLAPSIAAPSIASTQVSNRTSYLTLTPPYASKPATAAAFEAARIAKRYNFDLVYVVNLWPDPNRPQTSSTIQEDNSSFSSDKPARSASALTGRLLAAYGLDKVKHPFQISSSVHNRILANDGWIEYRSQEEACEKEFARGYACAFYKGNYSRSGSVTSETSTSSRCNKTDRGIVFAAYRKPRADGNLLGVNSSAAELADIYRDAEAMVEMLIDIHAANRIRQPQSYSQQVDETGPMPSQRPNESSTSWYNA